jgi:hypothetical protein
MTKLIDIQAALMSIFGGFATIGAAEYLLNVFGL